MNLNIYNSPEYQKKMQECIEQYELIDKLQAVISGQTSAFNSRHDEIEEARKEIDRLKAEVERLRGLCADMCDYIVACGGRPLDEWKNQQHIRPLFDEAQKAGRGEGERNR